jgi:allantoin racemase
MATRMRIRIVSAIYTGGGAGVPSPGTYLRRGADWLESRRKLFGLCSETEIDTVGIDKGPASIESRYDEVFAVPEIVRRVKEAEAEGVDACVINCFGDPGVRSSREVVSIPVLGPCESSLLMASSLCDRFSVITVLRSVAGLIRENARIYGLHERLASVRAVDIPVLDLHRDDEGTAAALHEEGRKAIEEDGAEALVLGCTGMSGMAARLGGELGVQVVDPLPAAVKLAETLVSLRLTHSKLAFPAPAEKNRVM